MYRRRGEPRHKPRRTSTLTLEMDGRAVQTQAVDVAAGASSSVTFAPVTVASRNMRGAVRLPDDGLERDNVFNFVASPLEPVTLAVVNRPRRRAGVVLPRARAGDRRAAAGRPRHADAGRRSPTPTCARRCRRPERRAVSDALADRLQRFVDRRRRVVRRGRPARHLAGAGDGPDAGVPARRSGRPHDRVAVAARRARVQPSGVRAVPRAAQRRFLRARGSTATAPCMQPDGQRARPVRRRRAGAARERGPAAGRVLIWTSTLDLDWNDLPVKPVFLPFVHTVDEIPGGFLRTARIIDRGAGRSRRRAKARAGAARARAASTSRWRHRARACRSRTRTARSNWREQGFYDVRTQGAPADSATTLASNVDPDESDLTPLDPRELAAAVARARARRALGGRAPAGRATTRRRRRSGCGGTCWSRAGCCSRRKRCSPIVFRRTVRGCHDAASHDSRSELIDDHPRRAAALAAEAGAARRGAVPRPASPWRCCSRRWRAAVDAVHAGVDPRCFRDRARGVVVACSAYVFLVAAAAAARHRRAGRAVSRGARAVARGARSSAPSKPSDGLGGAVAGAGRASWSRPRSRRCRAVEDGRRVERAPVRRYSGRARRRAGARDAAVVPARAGLHAPRAVGAARDLAERRSGGAVPHRGHARPRDRAARRRPAVTAKLVGFQADQAVRS